MRTYALFRALAFFTAQAAPMVSAALGEPSFTPIRYLIIQNSPRSTGQDDEFLLELGDFDTEIEAALWAMDNNRHVLILRD